MNSHITFTFHEVLSAVMTIAFFVVTLMIKNQLSELKLELSKNIFLLSETVSNHIKECHIIRAEVDRRLDNLEQ